MYGITFTRRGEEFTLPIGDTQTVGAIYAAVLAFMADPAVTYVGQDVRGARVADHYRVEGGTFGWLSTYCTMTPGRMDFGL